MRGYLGRVRGGRHRAPATPPRSSRRPRIEGGIAALRRAWEDGLRPDRRARDVGRDGDRRPARRPRARPARPAGPVGRRASTTSTSASTRTRRSRRSTSRSASRARPRSACLLAMIEGRDRRPAPVRLETRLIIRESTGPAPRGCGPRPMTRARHTQPPRSSGHPESASTRRRTDRTKGVDARELTSPDSPVNGGGSSNVIKRLGVLLALMAIFVAACSSGGSGGATAAPATELGRERRRAVRGAPSEAAPSRPRPPPPAATPRSSSSGRTTSAPPRSSRSPSSGPRTTASPSRSRRSPRT